MSSNNGSNSSPGTGSSGGRPAQPSTPTFRPANSARDPQVQAAGFQHQQGGTRTPDSAIGSDMSTGMSPLRLGSPLRPAAQPMTRTFSSGINRALFTSAGPTTGPGGPGSGTASYGASSASASNPSGAAGSSSPRGQLRNRNPDSSPLSGSEQQPTKKPKS